MAKNHAKIVGTVVGAMAPLASRLVSPFSTTFAIRGENLRFRRQLGVVTRPTYPYGRASVRLRCQSTSAANPCMPADAPLPDPLEWLEEVHGGDALAWVREQNRKAVDEVGDPSTTEAYRRILGILDSQEKIAYVSRLGDWYYNFWEDEIHQKGLWRRTTLDSYRSAKPDWQTVLDLDALAENEGISWVWGGYDALDEGLGSANKWDRVLITLSPGGSDAVVVREFDLDSCQFVLPEKGGFVLPEAKTHARYRTRDELLVGTDFGEDSLTASGYPRIVKSWRRGTPLAEAVTVFEGEHEDISADRFMYHDRGSWHEFQYRALDFYRTEQWYRPGSPDKAAADTRETHPFERIPVPDDAGVGTFGDAALITLRSDWLVSGRAYKSGSLLSLPLTDCIAGNFGDVQVLFEPTDRSALQGSTGTRNFMVLSVLNNVRTELQYWRYEGTGRWNRQASNDASGGVPVGCDVQVSAVWPDDSDDVWIVKDGYLQPDTLQLASAADCANSPEDLKAKPAMFDASALMVEQLEATSKDGVSVPYFVIRRKDIIGDAPTLLDGYGGFEIPMTPGYSGGVGAAWLEQGGIKVIANIRGGGEFGPSWHQAALREKRHKAYEDFEAVAQDLVDRRLTSPGKLACIGGSNGGLLVGNMLTREGARLFGAVVCQVPLLDMWRYHKLLAGASWMAEYGDPDTPEDWAFLRAYSPYHRIHDVCLKPGSNWQCPKVLFTTSTKDDRVHPGHARKMVRRLLDDVPRSQAPQVLYWENIEGGHGGAADNKQRAFMWALTYEFLWRTIGRADGDAADARARL